MGGLLSMTGPLDLIGGKRPQLRFSRFDEHSENHANNKDGNGDESFLHLYLISVCIIWHFP